MEPTENKQKKMLNTSAIHFPRQHLVLAGILTVCLTFMLTLFTSETASAKRQQQILPLNLDPSDIENVDFAVNTRASSTQLTTETQQTNAQANENSDTNWNNRTLFNWQNYTIKSGDSLATLFKRAGLRAGAMYDLIHAQPKAKALTKIFPGRTLSFAIDNKNQLQALRYQKSRLDSIMYTRTAQGFDYQQITRKPDARLAFRSAEIHSSLFEAGTDAGMSANLIMELANIFGWDIDFALDIRKGDRFNLLFEERFLDGEKIGHGKILAAEFVNQGDSFKAVRYTDSNNNAHYYTPEGKSMRKAFLRAPLDFSRISSNFNPRRLHPIHKTVRPHRGTDYAASRGTPVYAAGKGRVVTSAYNRASGNYVVIQHSSNIRTKYLHLTKRKVKKGQKVSQKQLIGTVGSTGYSTAPHLHYEFLLNGVHRNPRTILKKLPKVKSIPQAELARFKIQTQAHLAKLNSFQQSTILALATY